MKKMGKETRELLQKGIPLIIGAASASVISAGIKAHVPVKESALAKLMWHVGIFGLTTVVSSTVCSQMETEANAFFNAWDDICESVNEATKPTTLSPEDIAEIKAEVYNESYEGAVQPQGVEAFAE